MPEEFDVIVVGARCAGSSLAIRLARAGLRVCVLDQARFPSDTASTHAIQSAGVRVLAELGCYDALAARTEPIERGVFVVDDARIELDGVSRVLGAPMLNVRRVTLDAVLLDAAAEAGVDVRTATPVTGLVHEGGRVAGVSTAAGTVRAPLVVGADGVRSTVAGLVGAQEYARVDPGRLFVWGYFEGTDHPPASMWIGKIDDHAFLASPTDGGLFLAGVAPSMSRRGEVLADRTAAFRAGLRGWPELEAIVGPARRVGPLRTMPDWHGYFRPSAGPGWALVGDAGHFKDPTPGQGISDALRQTTRMAPAIVEALIERPGDHDALDAAMHRWWAWRDQDAWAMATFARQMGAEGPTPLLNREMLRRAGSDPRGVETLLRVFDHEIAPTDVFTAPHALSALVGLLRDRPGQRARVLREARALVADALRHRRPPRHDTLAPAAVLATEAEISAAAA